MGGVVGGVGVRQELTGVLQPNPSLQWGHGEGGGRAGWCWWRQGLTGVLQQIHHHCGGAWRGWGGGRGGAGEGGQELTKVT